MRQHAGQKPGEAVLDVVIPQRHEPLDAVGSCPRQPRVTQNLRWWLSVDLATGALSIPHGHSPRSESSRTISSRTGSLSAWSTDASARSVGAGCAITLIAGKFDAYRTILAGPFFTR